MSAAPFIMDGADGTSEEHPLFQRMRKKFLARLSKVIASSGLGENLEALNEDASRYIQTSKDIRNVRMANMVHFILGNQDIKNKYGIVAYNVAKHTTLVPSTQKYDSRAKRPRQRLI
ncbi:hypothetical protein ABW21_db0204894 [Orbilia brochopaga]|nr:hypothetical protein ABW21_db0204894 [Drechslerella brochopaga]